MRSPSGRTKSIWAAVAVSVLGFGAFSLLGAVPFSQAQTQTVISLTTSNGSTVCPSVLGGTWNATVDTCSMSRTLTIPSGTTLDVGAGVTYKVSVSGGGSSFDGGIYNDGTINNVGTIRADVSGGYSSYDSGIFNGFGTINNYGTLNGSGIVGIYNLAGTINNVGIIIGGGYVGIMNYQGTINNYCGGTVVSRTLGNTANPPKVIPCFTVTFDQSGIPSGVTWGVTLSWGPFVLPVDHTGTGSNLTVQATGSLNYSYDTPVTDSGTTYNCLSSCSGTWDPVSTPVTFSASYASPPASGTTAICSPSSVDVGSPATCTATVRGSSPTGSVTFSTSVGAASQFNSTACTLSSGTCAVAYTPSSLTVPVTITVSYGGDSSNLASSGDFTLFGGATVTPSSSTINAGHSVDIQVSWSTGGVAPYSVALYSGTSSNCVSDTTVVGTANGLASSPVSFPGIMPFPSTYFCAQVTDSASGSSTSAAAEVTVNLAPGVIMIITSYGSTVCPGSLGGTWDGTTDTCTVSGALTIPSVTTLDVGAGITINAGYDYYSCSLYGGCSQGLLPGGTGISNLGTINNNGTIIGYGGYGPDGFFSGDNGGTGISNVGMIYNVGTITGSGGWGGQSSEGSGGDGGNGIDNHGNIINTGTVTGNGGNGGTGAGRFGSGGNGGTGISNIGRIYNVGTVTGNGGHGRFGTWENGSDAPGIFNDFSIFDYCGVTVSSSPALGGYSPTAISCYTVTFDQSGLPTSAVVWGVTLAWGPFVLPEDHTGTGSSIVVQATGSMTYSYDTPVTGTGAIYGCTSGCSGTPSVTGPVTFAADYTSIAATTTSLADSVSGSTIFGTSVTFTATVSPAPDGGAVDFAYNGASITGCASVSLTGGRATCTTSSLPAGSDTVTATYSGDARYAGSVAVDTLTVAKASTSFTASASPSSAPYGTAVTLSESGLPAGATGTVIFAEGAVNFCTATLPATSCTTSATLPVGTFSSVTAAYSGDSNYDDSAATTSFTVTRASSTVAISVSPSSVLYGATVTYSVTVSPSAATGTVSFTIGSTTLCSATLSSGGASCTAANAPGGIDTVTGTYAGDSNYDGSSGTATLTVKVSTTTSVSCSLTSVVAGSSAECTATVTGSSPTGTVTWGDGGAGGAFSPSGACTLSSSAPQSSTCSVTYITPTSADTVTITGSYSGDSAHLASSGTSTLTVEAPAQAVQSLISSVDSMGLPHGTATSLDAKLNAALNSIDSGNDKAAANQLNAFINEVNAQAGKTITQAQALQLISSAQDIVDVLQS